MRCAYPPFYDSSKVNSVFCKVILSLFFSRPAVGTTVGIGFCALVSCLVRSVQALGHHHVRPVVSPPSIRRLLGWPNPACAKRSGDLDSNKPLLLGSVAFATRVGNGLVHFNLFCSTRQLSFAN